MSRTITATGHHSDLRAAVVKHGLEATFFSTSEPDLGSRLFKDCRRVGVIQGDPVSPFGDATLTLSTCWLNMAMIVAILTTLGGR